MPGRALKRVKVNYPCNICKHTCDESQCEEPSVLCDACDNWVHISCEQISTKDLCYLDGDHPYTCSVCIRTADGPTDALKRLKQVSRADVKLTAFTASREKQYIDNFDYIGKSTISSDFVEIDRNAQEIMKKSGLSKYGVPSLTTGDGNF